MAEGPSEAEEEAERAGCVSRDIVSEVKASMK